MVAGYTSKSPGQAWKLELHVEESPLPPDNPGHPEFGHLPPGVIQAVVRGGFHLIKACYDDGLRRNPRMEGRVSVRFEIERDGSVKSARDEGSDLSDIAVRHCVVRQFVRFKFPAVETGIVTVVYPIVLAPG
jgi:hypothetical protein